MVVFLHWTPLVVIELASNQCCEFWVLGLVPELCGRPREKTLFRVYPWYGRGLKTKVRQGFFILTWAHVIVVTSVPDGSVESLVSMWFKSKKSLTCPAKVIQVVLASMRDNSFYLGVYDMFPDKVFEYGDARDFWILCLFFLLRARCCAHRFTWRQCWVSFGLVNQIHNSFRCPPKVIQLERFSQDDSWSLTEV